MKDNAGNISQAAALGYMKNVEVTPGVNPHRFIAVNTGSQRHAASSSSAAAAAAAAAASSASNAQGEAEEGEEEEAEYGDETVEGENTYSGAEDEDYEEGEQIDDAIAARRSGYNDDGGFVAEDDEVVLPERREKRSTAAAASSDLRQSLQQQIYAAFPETQDTSRTSRAVSSTKVQQSAARKPNQGAAAGRSAAAGASKGGAGNRRTALAQVMFDAGVHSPASTVLPTTEPEQERTVFVRAVGNSGFNNNSHLRLEPYKHGASFSAKDWIDRFVAWAALTNIEPKNLPITFTWFQGDVQGRHLCQSIKQIPGEDPRNWLARMMEVFLTTFGQTELEKRTAQTQLMSFQKMPDENIDDYLTRWYNAWSRVKNGGSDADFTEGDFAMLLHSLGPAVCAHAAQWVWVGPTGTFQDDGSTRALRSRAQLIPLLRAYYQTRSRTDRLDDMVQSFTQCEARNLAHTDSETAAILNVDSTYRGTYNHHRHNEVGAQQAALQNPPLREETKQMWSKFKKTLADRNNGPAGLLFPPVLQVPEQKDRSRKKKNKRKHPSKDENPAPVQDRRSSKAPRNNNDRSVRLSNTATTQPPRGPCPNCGMRHDWEYCPRNKDGHRYQERAAPFLNKGPHPGANPEDCKKVGLPPPKKSTVRKDAKPMAKTDSGSESDSSSGSDSSSSSASSSSSGTPDQKPTAYARRIVIKPTGEQEIHIAGALNGLRMTDLLIDTGAQVSLLSATFYRLHQSRFSHLGKKPDYHVGMANGHRATVHGTCRLQLKLEDETTGEIHTMKHSFVVVDDLSIPVILGLDVCNRMFTSLDFQTGLLQFQDQVTRVRAVRIGPEEANDRRTPIHVAEATIIPPRSARMVLVHFDQRRYDKDAIVICEAMTLHDKQGNEMEITFPPHIQKAHPKNNRYSLLVHNGSSMSLTLSAGLLIGLASKYDGVTELPTAPQGQYRVRYDGELEPLPAFDVRSETSVDPASAGSL